MQTSDLDELKALVAELRADHVAQKEKEKRERWTKYVSLTMVLIAVLSAVATLRGGGFSTRSLKEMSDATFNQTEASDQWSYFEAKSIKQSLYEIELEHLMGAPVQDSPAIVKMNAKINQYTKDKAQINALAKNFESIRDTDRKSAASSADRSKGMGLSMTLFQVAIALGAMCLIVKKKPLWFAAMILSALAAAQMAHVLWFMPD